MNSFADQYASFGGQHREFAQEIIKLNLRANTSQANLIAESLRNPGAKAMQIVMGGKTLEDGR
jgi:hypothetical protein